MRACGEGEPARRALSVCLKPHKCSSLVRHKRREHIRCAAGPPPAPARPEFRAPGGVSAPAGPNAHASVRGKAGVCASPRDDALLLSSFLFLVLAALPEELGDWPYNVFGH
jgi:hypothetical protein